MNEHRYILEPYKGMKTRYNCPYCGKEKTFSRYIDIETGEHLNPTVGRCNREINCGKHYTPKQYFQDNNINPEKCRGNNTFIKPLIKEQNKTVLINGASIATNEIDFNKEYFTEIKVYDSSESGIISYLSLNDLLKRLNEFKRVTDQKDQNPAILKGIYKNGTAGENCTETAPFIFFDIDVKKNENRELENTDNNNKVFEYLKSRCIMVWRSNSQKGIAGIIYVPEISNVLDTGLHLEYSKKIYQYLTDCIETDTKLKIIFDWQQGKFRQIRYLAEQKELRTFNDTPTLFNINVIESKKEKSLIPVEVFKASLNPTAFEKNHFVNYLIKLFGVEITGNLISRYFIGTSKHWNGATVFWQIDKQGKVRTGKIMLYNPTTGKRIKEPESYITWVHKAIKQPEFVLKQCLFGEHLLNENKNKPVAIVESEKTAIIASVYLPQFVWVSVGSLSNLNAEKCSVLKGRTVILFPDLKGFEKWNEKAKELSNIACFNVSDLLERKATEAEKKQGFDLADYLIKFNYLEFAPANSEATKKPLKNDLFANEQNLTKLNLLEQQTDLIKPNISDQPKEIENLTKPDLWESDISELENYFAGIQLPTQPVKLNQCTTITDINIFIESHFATVKANSGNKNFLPYLNRLQELKQVLTNK